MCGIAGYFGFAASARAQRACLAELARRGPDGEGTVGWDEGGGVVPHDARFALLHTRLAIQDVRDIAAQPMKNDAGTLWISYNGEAFGWKDDASSLARSAPMRTASDTEFLLRGYEAWGIEGLLARLNGMFAFAIVDWRARRVALARDRLGVKSAVWFHDGRRFAFASTVRALMRLLPDEARALDPAGIDAFLAHRYAPSPLTCFANVRRLEPAQFIEFDLDSGAVRAQPYWRPQPRRASFADCVDQAIEQQTISDRPVGVFLSGGVDSTSVACSLARQGHRDIVALTASFAGSARDESNAAAALAQRLGLRHVVVDIPTASGAVFDQLVADLDEPFADPACLPLWQLAREATRHVKVVLSGDGGDELFAGYKRYAAHLRTRWRRHLRIGRRMPPRLPQPKPSRIADELAIDWRDAYALRFSGFSPAERAALQPSRSIPPTHWRQAWRCVSALETLIAIDFANYLPDYALRKGDLCTMAHGLEQRVPLLDYRVVEAVVAMNPADRFTRPPKLALRSLCPQLDGALYDPFHAPKRGFNPPVGRWMDEIAPRLARIGAQVEQATCGQIDAAAAQSFADGYRAGDRAREERVLQLLLLAESLASIAASARSG
jgi:asparagine synthase (glutamine-hydrolysing)